MFRHLDYSFLINRKNRFEPYPNSITAYKLKNDFRGTNYAYLRVDINLDKYYLRITGSLRKWYYGQQSLNDFTVNDFIRAIRMLGDYLGISYSDMLTMNLGSVEIGINVRSKFNFTTFKPYITGYKNNTYLPSVHRTSVSYSNKSFSIKIYDKVEEIITKSKLKKRILNFEEIEFFERVNNKNFIRVEFKLSHGKARIYSKAKIKTLGDTIHNFNYLYLFFWNSLHELQFSSAGLETIEFVPKNGSAKEFKDYLIEYALNSLGYENVISMIDRLKKENQRQVRMKIRRKFIAKENQRAINIKYEFYRTVKIGLIIALCKNKSYGDLKDVLFD